MNEPTFASYSMVLPSAEASRIFEPFGDAAMTVFSSTWFLYTPRVGNSGAVPTVRSTRATNGLPPAPSRITARMALEDTATDWTYPEKVLMYGLAVRVLRLKLVITCELSQPIRSVFPSSVCAIDFGAVQVRSVAICVL